MPQPTKCIFIKNPKTAGGYVKRILERHGIDFQFSSHHNAAAVREMVGESSWEASFKFSFVRNPWDRLVSFYWFHVQKRPQYTLIKEMSFEEFVYLVCSDDEDRIKAVVMEDMPFWRPIIEKGLSNPLDQIQYSEDLDFVGRFESLEDHLRQVLITFNKDYVSANPKNTSKHQAYTHYYSNELQEQVANRFSEEISRFGYQYQ